MKNPRYQPLNWKGKIFVILCLLLLPVFWLAWPWAIVIGVLAIWIVEGEIQKPILHYRLYLTPKKDTIGYRLAQICAPWFYLKKPFGRGSWCFTNPLWSFESVRYFYRSHTGRDKALADACADFLEEYATTQLGKTAYQFFSALGCQPDRLKDVRSWAYKKYKINFNEVIVEGTVLLEPPSPKEIEDAERKLQRAIDDANRFPSRARQMILEGIQQDFDDLQYRPRYQNDRIEHYFEIAYYDYPGFTKSEIRKKFIEDWNPQGLGMK